MKRWVKKDFEIVWEWHRSRIKGNADGSYRILWNGKELERGFPNKKWAERWLGDFLRKANELRKQAEAKGLKVD